MSGVSGVVRPQGRARALDAVPVAGPSALSRAAWWSIPKAETSPAFRRFLRTLSSCPHVAGTAPSAVARSPLSRGGSPGTTRRERGGVGSSCRVPGRAGRRSWAPHSRHWTGMSSRSSPASCRSSDPRGCARPGPCRPRLPHTAPAAPLTPAPRPGGSRPAHVHPAHQLVRPEGVHVLDRLLRQCSPVTASRSPGRTRATTRRPSSSRRSPSSRTRGCAAANWAAQ